MGAGPIAKKGTPFKGRSSKEHVTEALSLIQPTDEASIRQREHLCRDRGRNSPTRALSPHQSLYGELASPRKKDGLPTLSRHSCLVDLPAEIRNSIWRLIPTVLAEPEVIQLRLVEREWKEAKPGERNPRKVVPETAVPKNVSGSTQINRIPTPIDINHSGDEFLSNGSVDADDSVVNDSSNTKFEQHQIKPCSDPYCLRLATDELVNLARVSKQVSEEAMSIYWYRNPRHPGAPISKFDRTKCFKEIASSVLTARFFLRHNVSYTFNKPLTARDVEFFNAASNVERLEIIVTCEEPTATDPKTSSELSANEITVESSEEVTEESGNETAGKSGDKNVDIHGNEAIESSSSGTIQVNTNTSGETNGVTNGKKLSKKERKALVKLAKKAWLEEQVEKEVAVRLAIIEAEKKRREGSEAEERARKTKDTDITISYTSEDFFDRDVVFKTEDYTELSNTYEPKIDISDPTTINSHFSDLGPKFEFLWSLLGHWLAKFGERRGHDIPTESFAKLLSLRSEWKEGAKIVASGAEISSNDILRLHSLRLSRALKERTNAEVRKRHTEPLTLLETHSTRGFEDQVQQRLQSVQNQTIALER